MEFADFRDDLRAPGQEFEKLHVHDIDLVAQRCQTAGIVLLLI